VTSRRAGSSGLESLAGSVASAPLTFGWLLALLVTTRIQRSAGRREWRRIQRDHSTNLRQLQTHPLRALTTSLFWLDDRKWWPYVPLFAFVIAPAERKLRWWRWLTVGVAAHVVATYVSQAYLGGLIRTGRAPRRLVNARDVGVSYFTLGVTGAVTSRVEEPWRSRWQAAALLVLTTNVVFTPTFTEVGHLTAFGVGLAASRTSRSGTSDD
jgi:hypothetical protein